MEFDIYELGVPSAPKQNQLAYGEPLALVKAMGVIDPNNATSSLNNIYVGSADLTDASYDAKLDWKVPFKLSDYLSGRLILGGKYHSVDRTSDATRFQYYMQYGNGANTRNAVASFKSLFPGLATLSPPILENDQTGVPVSPFVDPNYTTNNILGYPVGANWDAYDLVKMTNALASIPSAAVWQDGVTNYSQTYTDKEKTKAGYLMGEFNIGSSLTIVPGARYQEEQTDISAYHIQPVTSNANGLGYPPVLVDSKRDNPYWYPSVNLKYKASENVQVMGAVYRSVSLPAYSEISPELEFQTPGYSLGGNPLLKPSTATNYDVGASLFSNAVGLFTVDLFYKDIKNLIYSFQNYFPYAPYPVLNTPADFASRLPNKSYFDSTYLNLNPATNKLLDGSIPMNDPADAYLRGIELSWQTHFWYLPGLLSGIVLELNASFMSSNEEYPYFFVKSPKIGTKDTLIYSTTAGPLQNQPKAIYNAILGWDYKGFSSRFSLRYQELTLQSLDTQYGLEDSYYDNVLLFDISLKQQIIDNLSVFANATNVNNHVDNYYFNHPAYLTSTAGSLPTSGQTYGLNAQFGISFAY
jgi:TonB-dependent receptor